MAIHRGIQSAIFYYLSCAPYFEAQTRRRRKEEAKRDRAARELLEADLPNLYRHPSPSSTNPHWQTEIALGPAPQSRGRKRQYQLEKQRSQRRPGTGSSDTSAITSTEDLPRLHSSDSRFDSKQNLRPYQREDEELWGSTANFSRSSCGDSIRRPPTARTKDSTRSNYQSFRNPAINDLHPATVTKVTSREEVMWMMQPPPVAEVMNGKACAIRSRSNSGISRPSSNHPSISKHSRLDPQRLASISTLATRTSVESSMGKASNDVYRPGHQHQRSADISERDFACPVPPRESHEYLRPAPPILSRGPSDSSVSMLHSATLSPGPSSSQSVPRSTPFSSNEVLFKDEEYSTPFESPNQISRAASPHLIRKKTGSASPQPHLTQGSAILVHDNSLKVVQDLLPGSASALNTKRLAPAVPPSHRHSPVDNADSSGTNSAVTMGPELFDNWYTPDFKLPEWVHEHTRREVEQRWSMDF